MPQELRGVQERQRDVANRELLDERPERSGRRAQPFPLAQLGPTAHGRGYALLGHLLQELLDARLRHAGLSAKAHHRGTLGMRLAHAFRHRPTHDSMGAVRRRPGKLDLNGDGWLCCSRRRCLAGG